jgi:hypothetical protein
MKDGIEIGGTMFNHVVECIGAHIDCQLLG